MSVSKLHEEVFDLLYVENKPEVAVLRRNRILEKTPENGEALPLKAYALSRLANARKE